ncbi:MAG TPA: ribonuclease E activity regulator RraA [Pseudomonadales bacterium]
MSFVTPDLCDDNPELVRVVEPVFNNYGGRRAFYGEIVTVKCHEDNSVLKAQASTPGHGKVMVVDGGGSLRCALLGDLIAAKAVENGWQGLIIYGCIRDVDAIGQLDLGVQALRTVPIKSVRKDRGDLNIAITFGGVNFLPGEYVYADNNGIIVSAKALI